MNDADKPSPNDPKASADTSSHDQQMVTGKAAGGSSEFRFRRVLMVVVPVAVLLFGVLALLRFADVDAIMSDLTRPSMVAVEGQILFNGEPLRNAQIITEPVEEPGMGAMGWTDDEGNFSLKTDIRGEFVEGATVGEHRVAVTAYQMIAAPVAPPLLTPQQYASVQTSPLRITVASDPEQNQVKLELEGEPPSRPGPPGGGGPPPGTGNSPGGQRPSQRPAEDAPSEEVPSEETPSEEAPSEEVPSEETPSEETPSEEAPAEETPSEEARGDAALSEP